MIFKITEQTNFGVQHLFQYQIMKTKYLANKKF